MPGRRTTIDSTGLWLSQNLVWLGCSFLAWLVAVWQLDASGRIGLAGLLVYGLAIASITLALRIPVLWTTCLGNRWLTQSIWLIGCMATLNWCGFLLLSADTITDALPALLLVLGSEGWLHRQVARQRRIPIILRRLRSMGDWLVPSGVSAVDAGKATLAETGPHGIALGSDFAKGGIEASLVAAAESQREESQHDEILRRSMEGVDESGQHFQSGELQVLFAEQQSVANVLITFCTAFSGVPTVDLEYEQEASDDVSSDDTSSDELSMRPTNTTPNGMRLMIRRSSPATAANFRLQWHAHLDSTQPNPSPLKSILP